MNVTYSELLYRAMKQSAVDLNVSPEDFRKQGSTAAISRKTDGQRAYLSEPLILSIVSYGGGIVASCREELVPAVADYINKYEWYRCFETPNVHEINSELVKRGYHIKFMAEYFLPDPDKIPNLDCAYETRELSSRDFSGLYLDCWSNALCEKRAELDVMGVGAYDNGRLIGLAACSRDCEDMYQIGIDVLPEYRRQGVAGALTSRLAKNILAAGKVPFYCAAWSNIISVRNALKCGFKPAWIELGAAEI